MSQQFGHKAKLLLFAIGGIGLALVVYRFAMQPIGWNGAAKSVVELGGICSIAASTQLLRRNKTKLKAAHAMPIIAGFGVAFGLAYAFVPGPSRSTLTEKALPGFTIALPPGGNIAEQLDYMKGQYTLSNVAGTDDVIQIQWHPGSHADAEQLGLLARGLSGAFDSSGSGTATQLPGPGGELLPTVELSSPKGRIRMSAYACDRRQLIVATIGDEIQALHRRILPTIGCKPDPSRQTEPDTVAGMLDLPAPWHPMDAEAGQTGYSDGDRVLLLTPVTALPDDAALAKLIEPMLAVVGENVKLGAKRDGRFQLTGTFDGEPGVGWLWPIQCGNRAVLALGVASDDTSAGDLATVFQNAQRCSGQK